MLDIIAVHNSKQALKNSAWKNEAVNFKADFSKYRNLPEEDKQFINFFTTFYQLLR